MTVRLALAAAVALTAAPLAGSASAKCQPHLAVVCNAITTACDTAQQVPPLDKYCNIQP